MRHSTVGYYVRPLEKFAPPGKNGVFLKKNEDFNANLTQKRGDAYSGRAPGKKSADRGVFLGALKYVPKASKYFSTIPPFPIHGRSDKIVNRERSEGNTDPKTFEPTWKKVNFDHSRNSKWT